jgi:heat shock protein HslJ
MRPRRASGLALVGVVLTVVVVVTGVLVVARVLRAGEDNANGSVAVRSLGDLRGTWTAVNDVGAPAPVVNGSSVVLVFDGGSLRATTGCNALTGAVDVVDSTLVVEGLGGTDMGCAPSLLNQQQWVGEMLQARPRLELSGPTLSLLWGEHWLGLSSEASP